MKSLKKTNHTSSSIDCINSFIDFFSIVLYHLELEKKLK